MESESGSKRPADQLQGPALQNQAVRSVASRGGLGPIITSGTPITYKVVVRFENHAVRGFAQASELGSVEQLLRNAPQHSLETIRLTTVDSGEVRVIQVRDAKAIFFVRTFDGDLNHRALHFHENAPVMEGLWVRVRFQDGEVIEGLISNTFDHVLGEGFFMMPTDPNGNNRLIYVLKSRLRDFNVLGIRNAPKVPIF